ncbi:glycosyl transferase group 1 [Jimgerdemannia flammicorona]|uniref:Glycosyl transferase group 1 n=1 Tax=Jimgerdemannia flammicorona TaxID=994334 RepID=A0A433P9Z0_9FUNG|nr:glycosyl transferase group 1 [Jimgerdemannia flammicorona]
MKIAIITENFLPKVDGVTRTLGRLLEHLEANGHEAMVLGPESGMETYAGAQLVGTAGIPFSPYPELKLNLWRPLFNRKLQEFQPDVLHFVDPVWLGATGIAASYIFFNGVPTISSYHTNLAAYCGHFGWGFFTPFMWAWNRWCHSLCALTFCPSKSTSAMLRKQGFKNLRIWPRGVDISFFSPSCRSPDLRSQWLGGDPPDSKTILLYVGRISFEKNLGLVIQAYKRMDHSRCHLVIVGHGPAFEEIQDEFAASNTPVTFTGYLQGCDLATAYASADIFAFPSFTETFGQVVLESMASGLPVVGLNAEGVCDLVTHERTGLLLEVGGMEREHQYEAYRSYLERMIEEPETRKRMGEEAVAGAQDHTWAEAMEKLVRGYREVVAKARRAQRIKGPDDGEDSGVEEDFDEGFEGSVEGNGEAERD